MDIDAFAQRLISTKKYILNTPILMINFDDMEERKMMTIIQKQIINETFKEIDSYHGYDENDKFVEYCENMETNKGNEKHDNIYDFLKKVVTNYGTPFEPLKQIQGRLKDKLTGKYSGPLTGKMHSFDINKFFMIGINLKENVKPFFDFDVYDDSINFDINKRNSYIVDIIKFMKAEFPKGDILYSENHRLNIINNKYKYSFQVIIDNYYTSVADLYNFVTNLKSVIDGIKLNKLNKSDYPNLNKLKHLNIFKDIDNSATLYPRGTNSKAQLRFGFSRKDKKNELFPVVSDPRKIDRFILSNTYDCGDNLYKYDGKYGTLYEHKIIDTNNKSRAHVKNKIIVSKTIMNNNEDEITPEFNDNDLDDVRYKVLSYVVMNLSSNYYEKYFDWVRVCWCLRKYHSSQNVYDLFVKFSKRTECDNFDESSCVKYWNECNMDSKWNIMSLRNFYKDSLTKNPSATSEDQLFYQTMIDNFSILAKYDPLDGIKKLNNIEHIKIDVKYIEWDIFTNHTEIDNKIICIKSPVGTGKTQYIKSVIEHYKKLNEVEGTNIEYVFLSIVSRVSLAKKHAQDFKLSYYKDQKNRKLNSVYQLESLHHLFNEIKFYESEEEYNVYKTYMSNHNLIGANHKLILIVDEFNSFMKQFESMTIKSKCFKTLEYFNKFIEKSHLVIVADADISTPPMMYLNNVSNKQIILYENINILRNDIPTTFMRYSQFVTKIAEVIKSGSYAYVCCDSRRKLLKLYENVALTLFNENNEEPTNEVIERCRKELDNISLTYARQIGNLNDIEYVEDTWKNKNIFCSPTIQYGISFDEKDSHHTFSCCMRANANARENVQQAYRVRHPITYNIHIHECTIEKTSKTLKNIIDGRKTRKVDAQLIRDNLDSDDISDYIEEVDAELINLECEIYELLKENNNKNTFIDIDLSYDSFLKDYTKFELKKEDPLYTKIYQMHVSMLRNASSLSIDDKLSMDFINYRIYNKIDNIRTCNRKMIMTDLLNKKGHMNIIDKTKIDDTDETTKNILKKIDDNNKILNAFKVDFEKNRLFEYLNILIEHGEGVKKSNMSIKRQIEYFEEEIKTIEAQLFRDNDETINMLKCEMNELHESKKKNIYLFSIENETIVKNINSTLYDNVGALIADLFIKIKCIYTTDFLIYFTKVHSKTTYDEKQTKEQILFNIVNQYIRDMKRRDNNDDAQLLRDNYDNESDDDSDDDNDDNKSDNESDDDIVISDIDAFYYFAKNTNIMELEKDAKWSTIMNIKNFINTLEEHKHDDMNTLLKEYGSNMIANNDLSQNDQMQSYDGKIFHLLKLHEMIFKDHTNLLNYDIIRDVLNKTHNNTTFDISRIDINVLNRIRSIFNLNNMKSNQWFKKYNDTYLQNDMFYNFLRPQKGLKENDKNSHNEAYLSYLTKLSENKEGRKLYYEAYDLLLKATYCLFDPLMNDARYKYDHNKLNIDKQYHVISSEKLENYINLFSIKNVIM